MDEEKRTAHDPVERSAQKAKLEIDVDLATEKTLDQLRDLSRLLARFRDAADEAVKAIAQITMKWEREREK